MEEILRDGNKKIGTGMDTHEQPTALGRRVPRRPECPWYESKWKKGRVKLSGNQLSD